MTFGERKSNFKLQKATILKILCAWCGKVMGEKDGKGAEGITHGICPECRKKYFPQKNKCL